MRLYIRHFRRELLPRGRPVGADGRDALTCAAGRSVSLYVSSSPYSASKAPDTIMKGKYQKSSGIFAS
jgi:hypothetical protein